VHTRRFSGGTPGRARDGAIWIWNIADDQFSGATQIVDRYHSKQHLSDLGKALYGPTNPRAAQWSERRCDWKDKLAAAAGLSFQRRRCHLKRALAGFLLNLISNGPPLLGSLLPAVFAVAMKGLPVQARKQKMDALCRLPGSERKRLEARRRRFF
jgi:hypothetical protein